MSARSDEAAQAAIGAAARELRLPTIRAEVDRPAEIATREHQSYLVFLAELLAAEVDDRAERRRARRITEAKAPRTKRLSEFNVDAVPSIEPAQLATLASGSYLKAGEPVVLLGDSGTGKTHLLIGLGLAACEQGRKVRYVTCAQLVNELVEAADERVLSRVVARYGRSDLLLLDELGYVQIDPRGAELLFQIITEREERASIGLASNLPFSEWGSVFPDPRLVAAIVDRITFNAHILETGTQSYRLRTTKDHRPPQARRLTVSRFHSHAHQTGPPSWARDGAHLTSSVHQQPDGGHGDHDRDHRRQGGIKPIEAVRDGDDRTSDRHPGGRRSIGQSIQQHRAHVQILRTRPQAQDGGAGQHDDRGDDTDDKHR